MISISERLRARQEPVGDGSGKWRKDGLCQEAADVIDAHSEHLGNVLMMLAELHPDDRCQAFDDAMTYYNKQNPGKQVVPVDGYSQRLVRRSPLDPALAKAKGKQA